MFAIGVPPGTRLPFTTVVAGQLSFEHQHRTVTGHTWKEPMTLEYHLLAVRLDQVGAPCNDNEEAA